MTNTIEDTERVTWESARAWIEHAEIERALARSLEDDEPVRSTQWAAMQSSAERLLASFRRQAELRAKMGRR